ncbi:MAG: GGDEF domain-containing protein [Alphaproteobacteria bacterium]|nr:GGDEF domain-containing protein [Alphaproteobacteria bacterium]
MEEGLSHNLVSGLLGQTAEAVVIGGADGGVTHVSAAAAALLGHEPRDMLGRAMPALCAALAQDGALWQGVLPAAAGREARVTLRKSWIAVDGDQVAVIARLERETAAGIDLLTGLPDVTIFHDRVQQAILNAGRLKKSVAVMVLGVDRLAMVNEGLGSAAGDAVLVELAERLRRCVRQSDTVTRMDGDHFGMVLSISAIDDGVLVAEKIFHAMGKPFVVGSRELTVGASAGIGLWPTDADSHPEVVKKAESALRFAKASGRGQYQFSSNDMNTRARARLELESRMRRALTHSEFRVFYQPKVDAQSGVIVGMEALVRWQDPEHGLISPGDFIPVAEETGLIIEIGSFVLAEACRQNAAWVAEGLPRMKLSVNVSARQFRSAGLVDEVSRVLAETRLPPAQLELEITESMLMDDIDRTVAKMQALRDLGCGLSIDDFGTGYSSLSYLGMFPITTLKIDRAFVKDVESNPKTAEIARAIIGLSKGLELDIVAEGAEIIEHVQFLRDHGCALVQGFYFSRPLPAHEFADLVRRGPMK